MKNISKEELNQLLEILKLRFEQNMGRHQNIKWDDVEKRIFNNDNAIYSLFNMEKTGGEPDVVKYDDEKYVFFDCSKETPIGRRSLCYDKEALESRKSFKPENNVMDLAAEMKIEVLNEEEYIYLQSLGDFDLKSSSWIKSPSEIRILGGALFGDKRYNRVFIYHNGAESYYAARAFRGLVKV